MNKRLFSTILAFMLVNLFFIMEIKAQPIITPEKGFSPQIGVVVSMMEDLKSRVTRSVARLSQSETDFLIDEDANRIGALILHLAATEAYYQVYTFENRGFNKEEAAKWEMALNLGAEAREKLTGKPIQYYLDIWDETRKKSKELLKMKDDTWFAKKVPGSSMNNHWAWYHVMEHQANHMGQIRFFIKRLP